MIENQMEKRKKKKRKKKDDNQIEFNQIKAIQFLLYLWNLQRLVKFNSNQLQIIYSLP